MHSSLTTGTGVKLVPLFLSLLWLACSPEPANDEAKKQLIQQLLNDPAYQQSFIFEEGGEETDEETQWARISQEEGRWHYLEVYNYYVRENGQQEYNLYEFHLDPTALGERFTVLDYELRLHQDSSWFALPTEMQGSLDSILIAGADTIYRLLGYAHTDDPTPGHIRYWSPDYGTLLTWYGGDRYFEQIKAFPGQDTQRLTLLKGIAFQDIRKP